MSFVTKDKVGVTQGTKILHRSLVVRQELLFFSGCVICGTAPSLNISQKDENIQRGTHYHT